MHDQRLARRRAGLSCAAHLQHQLGEQQPPFAAPPSASGNLERLGAVRRVREDQLVLVDVAERHDARQHGGAVFSSSRNASRASAQARRVGRNSVAVGERERIGGSGKPAISGRLRNARISVGRNGAEAGIVKTRGAWPSSGRHSASRPCR